MRCYRKDPWMILFKMLIYGWSWSTIFKVLLSKLLIFFITKRCNFIWQERKLLVTFIDTYELLVCTRRISRRLYVRNLVWNPNRPRKYCLYQIRIVDQKSIDLEYSDGKSIMMFSISKRDLSDWNAYPEDIAFRRRNVKSVWLYSFSSWWFLSHWGFPWQGFNEATKNTQMIDTRKNYYDFKVESLSQI